MRYKLLIMLFTIAHYSMGQSLFNRWVGTDPFTGSVRSTAMGSTHLLNSSGSSNARFNPANLTSLGSLLGFDLQIDRLSMFERWSMPVRDSFGEFLTNADYVANEFSYYGFRGGVHGNINLLNLGKIGLGFHHAPLAHFTYHYLEEVRGSYQIEDGEYASKDPIVGYQELRTDGSLTVSSFGSGMQLNVPGDIDLSLGGSIHFVQSTKDFGESISDRVQVDTLYSDVTNLSTYPYVHNTHEVPASSFMGFSAQLNLFSSIHVGASWEEKSISKTDINSFSIDSTSTLFQFWSDTSYVVLGVNYMKPEIISLALSFLSGLENMMSINFEYDKVSFGGHLNLKDYEQYKFGFEYITSMGTPIRGGLTYQTPKLLSMSPVSMFTFGTGKTIRNMVVDVSGTYCFHSFSHPDLFPVEGDIRSDYDLVRESQLQLQLALSYRF